MHDGTRGNVINFFDNLLWVVLRLVILTMLMMVIYSTLHTQKP